MSQLAAEPSARLPVAEWRDSSLLAKLQVVVAAAAGSAIFWWAGKAFLIPRSAQSASSVLASDHATISLLVVTVCFIVCTFVGTLIAGRVRFDAGLLTGAAGLVTLSIRGRGLANGLRAADPSASAISVFHGYAVELGLLYAVLLIGWGVLWGLHAVGWLHQDALNDDLEDVDESVVSKLTAAGGNLVFFALLTMLLTPTDAKAQVLLGIGCAAFVGTLVSHSLFPVRPSLWFWAAPQIVGTASYLWAPHVSPNWRIGTVGTAGKVFGPYPARALPLDFAGAGTIGTLLGYWLSRKFHRNNLLVDTDAGEEIVEGD